MGPSGCGKSSLLAFICGTLDPAFAASGRVASTAVDIGGLPPELRGIGILFQDDLLFPHMTVGENLAFATAARFRWSDGRRPAVSTRPWRRPDWPASAPATRRLSPADSAPGSPCCGRCCPQPRALLLDEPFNKLDAGFAL